MVITLAGDVDYPMLKELIKESNTAIDDIHIYFTSPTGGSTDVALAIVDFINRQAPRIKITFYGELFSAGMTIFLATKCDKEILTDTRGMYHFAYQEMAISEHGKPTSQYDIFSMREMKSSKKRTSDFLKTTKLSDKEVASILKGKDVYFSSERMKELL